MKICGSWRERGRNTSQGGPEILSWAFTVTPLSNVQILKLFQQLDEIAYSYRNAVATDTWEPPAAPI